MQRELLDVAIRWFETLNLATGAALTHLRSLRHEIELRPAAAVLKMPERHADSAAKLTRITVTLREVEPPAPSTTAAGIG